MIIAGIDFSTDRQGNTWLARGKAQHNRVTVFELEPRSHGALFVDDLPSVTGIDVPLGWPRAFQQEIAQFSASEPTDLGEFPERLTDRVIAKKLPGIHPLSVAGDKIARCTFQAANLLSQVNARINPVAPCVEHCVIEVYPKATLAVIAGDKFNEMKLYKGTKPSRYEARERIFQSCVAPRIDVPAQFGSSAIDSDDALDALLALITAFAFSQGCVEYPSEDERAIASTEGWIYVPAL